MKDGVKMQMQKLQKGEKIPYKWSKMKVPIKIVG